MSADIFYDTNIVLYLLSDDTRKADRAEELLALGGKISVQVLNEFTAVARRKLKMDWADSEDMQNGQVIEQKLTICNPF